MNRIVQCCVNCKHYDLTAKQRPCSLCETEIDGYMTKFELPEWHKQIFEDAKRWKRFESGYKEGDSNE